VRPYEKNVSLARLGSHRDFGRTFERLASESVSSGQLARPDIILASLPPFEGPEAAARLARRLDATFVLDLMDVWPETFDRLLPGPGFVRRLLSPFFLGSMHRRREELVAAADAVSAATQTYADAVLAAAPAALPRHLCYVGAYPQEFPAPRPAVNEVPMPDGSTPGTGEPGPLECVYAGTLEAGQDLDTLAAAARQLSAMGANVTIHVAGTGSHEPALRRAAATTGGSCRLEVHGLLPRQAYVSLLSRCDVGLVCVKPESFVAVPYKACDYAAAGLALVNSLPGELQQLIDRHSAGVPYTSGDAASLARVIADLAANRMRLADLRLGARRLVAAEFDRERTYAAFADWLETVTG
jgi:glycosyltransferase involved in cell wall biosynthesis